MNKTENTKNNKTLEEVWQEGLLGSGILHESFVSWNEDQKAEDTACIYYGFHKTPFGKEALLAQSEIGLCWLSFLDQEKRDEAYDEMLSHFPKKDFVLNQSDTKKTIKEIFAIWEGREEHRGKNAIVLDVQGTEFQKQVWQALLKIPSGVLVSYKDVAVFIGNPDASQAVGQAVGANPVGLLIPCHRVIQTSGGIGGYRGGVGLKEKILEMEASLLEARAG